MVVSGGDKHVVPIRDAKRCPGWRRAGAEKTPSRGCGKRWEEGGKWEEGSHHRHVLGGFKVKEVMKLQSEGIYFCVIVY